MQHTLAIFRHFYNSIPPLFPGDIEAQIKKSLEDFENSQGVSLEDLEKEMIRFGYFVWPWQQAYKEFLRNAEYQVGEHFLLSHVSEATQNKINEFMEYGGTLADLYSGRPAEYFTGDERVELAAALVDARRKLKEYVDREVVGLSKEKYLERVDKYNEILTAVQAELNDLKELAWQEQDHPLLASEMREKIRNIEHGLCLLGSEFRYDEVKNMREFYCGRKQELDRMRGIDVPRQIDFYNSYDDDGV